MKNKYIDISNRMCAALGVRRLGITIMPVWISNLASFVYHQTIQFKNAHKEQFAINVTNGVTLVTNAKYQQVAFVQIAKENIRVSAAF
jgi:hypothetical protein